MMSKAITECHVCGKPIEQGSRAHVVVHWELGGSRLRRASKSSIVCRECASAVAEMMGYEDYGKVMGE